MSGPLALLNESGKRVIAENCDFFHLLYGGRMNSFTLYADMVRYFRQPIFTQHREKLNAQNLIALLGLIGLVVLTVIPLNILSAVLLNIAGESPLKASEDFQAMKAGASFVLIAVIMAPFIEEMLFRSWLGMRWGVLLVMPALLIFWACFKITLGLQNEALVSVLRWVLIFGLGLYFWVFWGTAIYFGMIHKGNFSSDYSIFLWPIALLPLIFAGAVLGFVRMRFGLWIGMVFHGGYNGLIIFISSLAGG